MSVAELEDEGADRWRPQVEIDLAALCANGRTLAAAADGAEPAAVVKCDAYGLGAVPVARALARHEGVNTYYVAYPEEGAALRAGLADVAPDAIIRVFNGPAPETLAMFRRARLTPVLNTIEQARLWRDHGRGVPATLHVDTGLHRLATPREDLAAASALDGLAVDLVISHLACAADPASPFNETQRARLAEIGARFPGARLGLASSAGVFLGKGYALDEVRLGVSLYGIGPFDTPDPRIRPVARLTGAVVETQQIAPGESVGYGRRFVAARPTTVATISLGYGDGLHRLAGGRARVRLGGALCPVIGRVSMDLTTVDVTDAPAPVTVGDRAEIFGPDTPIETLAEACETIAYELLTGLGRRVVRRYLWNGAPADPALIGAST